MNPPQVLISRQEDFSPEAVDEFTASLSELSIPFEVNQTERRAYNGIEELLPTAVVVFLAKPFFDAFLKKAGEDAYWLFKQALTSLVSKASKIPIWIVKGGTAKIADVSPYSRVISIYAQSETGIRIKFLMPSGKTIECYDKVIEDLFALLRENQTSSPDDPLSKLLKGEDTRTLKVLKYDFKSASWQHFKLGDN